MFIPLSDIRKWLQEYHFPIYPFQYILWLLVNIYGLIMLFVVAMLLWAIFIYPIWGLFFREDPENDAEQKVQAETQTVRRTDSDRRRTVHTDSDDDGYDDFDTRDDDSWVEMIPDLNEWEYGRAYRYH